MTETMKTQRNIWAAVAIAEAVALLAVGGVFIVTSSSQQQADRNEYCMTTYTDAMDQFACLEMDQ